METGQVISIIVPVYNVENYVERCIRSIMAQTYPCLEIIVVDDGSTDCSGNICDELGKEDSRIKVLHQSNQGVVRARRNGLNIARGELIGFVDGDDYIEPVMYERLHKLLTEYEADFVHSGFFYNNKQNVEGVKKRRDIRVTEEDRADLIKSAVFGRESASLITPSIWSKLFKRDLVIKSYSTVPDFSCFGEDLLCLCSCFMTCNRVFITQEAYYHYTLRDNSLAHEEDITMVKKLGSLHNVLHEMFTGYGMWESLKEWVDNYYLLGIMRILAKRQKGSLNRSIQIYKFPDIRQMFGKRIILYGAGAVGCDYYIQIRKYVECELIAWTDIRYAEYKCDYCELIDPRMIPDYEYDVILIGVMDEKAAEEIKNSLVQIGIPEEKICWKCPEEGI